VLSCRRAAVICVVASVQCRQALTPDAFTSALEQGAAFDGNAAADWALQIREHARTGVFRR
jgi:hypothetical protein